MTGYLIAARAAIILWTSLAVLPAEIVFDAMKPKWSAAASSYKRCCLRPFVARAAWNGIAIRTKPRRTPSFISSQREQSWSTK
jgi:hypothetical protein